jgi:hypothetical protein
VETEKKRLCPNQLQIWGNRVHGQKLNPRSSYAYCAVLYSLDHCLHTHAVRKGPESGNSGKYPRWRGGEREVGGATAGRRNLLLIYIR